MDLQTIFSALCNMTITASVVTGCVLLARLLLKKAPRGFVCALWLVVLFRLLCPVAPSGPVSVLNIVDAPRVEAPVSTVVYLETPVRAPAAPTPAEPSQAPEPSIDWHLMASRVWAAGMTLLIGYGIVSYVNLKRKLRESVPLGPGLREADGIKSPFLLGFLRPVIYLPSGLTEGERGHILLHERCHLRHGDHLVKAVFWLAVCIHWFNPLAWLAFVLCGRDMEMRCDEAVLKSLGPQVRSDYAQSLLSFATGRRMAPAPLAFGEGDTGKRVKHVLKWKKRSLWLTIPAAVLCAVVLLITVVNPGGQGPESPFGHSYKAVSSYASVPDYPFTINTCYTLSSDMGLFIQEEKTEQVGFFREVQVNADNLKDFSDGFWKMIRRSWNIEGTGWWLMEHKRGDLQLHNLDQQVTHTLVRTDLLEVTVSQPGIESIVEPVWYLYEDGDWLMEDLPGALVNGEAQIVLRTEKDLETITVEETYYQATVPGLYDGIRVTEYVLHRDANGDFILTVRRRGNVGEDNAVYRVTVGEDRYRFRLTFPREPSAGEPAREVTYSENGVYITLSLPESWDYTLVPSGTDGYAGGGIIFWPAGREEGRLRFEYYPNGFGVCGTGLETEGMTLAGRTATAGTYDGEDLWTYLSFGDDFAVWGENHEAWWAVYGEQAMAILNSASFGPES